MSASANVIVIGAGIVGASIGWHLAASGARVTIVDSGPGGGLATPASFAWINASWGNPEPYYRLRVRSMAEWKRLAAAVPAIPLAWCGGLGWDVPAERLDAVVQQHSAWGYGVRRVDPDEARRIEPALAAAPDNAIHVAEEGAVEPHAAARALIGDAERRGARRQQAEVLGLLCRGDRVVGIETAAGPLHADEVVLAAGLGTTALAASAGVAVPLQGRPGLIVHTRPRARLLRGVVHAPDVHMRQSPDGRVHTAATPAGGDPGADPRATAEGVLARVRSLLRDADDLALEHHTIGLRPTPRDGFPIVGRPRGRSGLYVAAMHSGITLAPAIGAFAAAEVLEGRRDPLLAPYGPDRFAAVP